MLERTSSSEAIEILHCSHSRDRREAIQVTSRSPVAHSEATGASWDFVHPDHLALARRLQNGHPALATMMTRVSAGPATGRDSIFIVSDDVEVESELLQPIVRGRYGRLRDGDRAVVENPALEEFVRLVEGLKKNPLLSPHIRRGEITFEKLTLDHIAKLLREETAYYFLLAAAGLNRSSLKREAASETARIAPAPQRRAFAVRQRLPVRKSFAEIANNAALLRTGDLDRRSRG